MRHFLPTVSRRPQVLVAGALAALALTAGCGGNDPVTADPGEVASTVPATPSASATTPAATPAATTSPAAPTSPTTGSSTPTPRPTKAPTTAHDQVGDGGADDVVEPATAGGGICAYLDSAAVGTALGNRVHGSAIPGGGGGCQFVGGGDASTSATVQDRPYDAARGMQAAKDEATSAVEGTPEDLSGIGTAAFVVTGTMFGGEDVQGAGAVRDGSRLISITVTQESGLSADQVRAKAVALLKLIAGKR